MGAVHMLFRSIILKVFVSNGLAYLILLQIIMSLIFSVKTYNVENNSVNLNVGI